MHRKVAAVVQFFLDKGHFEPLELARGMKHVHCIANEATATSNLVFMARNILVVEV